MHTIFEVKEYLVKAYPKCRSLVAQRRENDTNKVHFLREYSGSSPIALATR